MGNINERVNVGVGVLVLNHRAEVLLGKRVGKHGAGEYSLAGGKPDGGESPSEAASRELWEETGLHVPPEAMRPVGHWTYDVFEDHEIHFVTLYFMCNKPPNQEPVNTEPEKCEGWGWYAMGKPPEPLFSGVGETLRHLIKPRGAGSW